MLIGHGTSRAWRWKVSRLTIDRLVQIPSAFMRWDPFTSPTSVLFPRLAISRIYLQESQKAGTQLILIMVGLFPFSPVQLMLSRACADFSIHGRQLLQRRIIQQPVDLARAIDYDNLTETNAVTRMEP